MIATDPIGLRRPQAVTTYIDEIKKVTSQPIKYVIYSHSHYDHIAGGKPFKDLGARFIAHKNAKAQLERLQPPNIVMPDEVVDDKRTITLGGTTLELIYVGRNHSDNTLVMRLPKEKLIFAVDFDPDPDAAVPAQHARQLARRVGGVAQARARHGLGDADPRPSRTRRPARHQAGCREPAAATCRTSAAEVKKAADEGKCYDDAMKEVKLPKYEKWGNYAAFLPGNVERYCYLNNGN